MDVTSINYHPWAGDRPIALPSAERYSTPCGGLGPPDFCLVLPVVSEPQGDVLDFVDLFFEKRFQFVISIADILSPASILDNSGRGNVQGLCNLDSPESQLPAGYITNDTSCLRN